MNQTRLSDRDALADCLGTAKFISGCYHKAMLESAHQHVWDTLSHCHNEELSTCRMLFQTMYSKGWYQVQPATLTTGAYPTPGAYTPPGVQPTQVMPPGQGAYQGPGFQPGPGPQHDPDRYPGGTY